MFFRMYRHLVPCEESLDESHLLLFLPIFSVWRQEVCLSSSPLFPWNFHGKGLQLKNLCLGQVWDSLLKGGYLGKNQFPRTKIPCRCILAIPTIANKERTTNQNKRASQAVPHSACRVGIPSFPAIVSVPLRMFHFSQPGSLPKSFLLPWVVKEPQESRFNQESWGFDVQDCIFLTTAIIEYTVTIVEGTKK